MWWKRKDEMAKKVQHHRDAMWARHVYHARISGYWYIYDYQSPDAIYVETPQRYFH